MATLTDRVCCLEDRVTRTQNEAVCGHKNMTITIDKIGYLFNAECRDCGKLLGIGN